MLQQRLTAKRREIGFLVQMMEISPEMVAVIFHRGFRYTRPSVLEHLLTLEPDDFPSWDSLADSFEWQPWAQDLADVVLEQPTGEAFMTLTLALEYQYSRPSGAAAGHIDRDGDKDDDAAEGAKGERDDEDDDDADNQRLRDEAGADWMAEQGFDRKD